MKENDGSGEDFLDLLLSTNANWSKDVGLNQKKNRYFLCLCAFISAGQNLLQVSDSSRRQLDELKTWLNVRHKPHTRGEKILLFQRSSSKSLIQVSCMVKTLWSQCIIMMKLFFLSDPMSTCLSTACENKQATLSDLPLLHSGQLLTTLFIREGNCFLGSNRSHFCY